MLKAGDLTDDGQLEAGSMARAIEDAMVANAVLNLDDETPEAAEQRRKTFVSIAQGVINHLTGNLEVVVAANKFGTAPAASVTLSGSAGEVR